MKRKITTITLVMFALLLMTQIVFAEVTAPTSLNKVTSSRRDLSALPDQQQAVIAGNVTQLSLDVLTTTKSWAGAYGNISGTITLDNSNNDTFYNWTGITADGEIYASRVDINDFSSVQCATETDKETEDAALNNDASASDNVNKTFATKNAPDFNVGTVSITGSNCYHTNAFNSGGAQTADFHQVLLDDGSNNMIYTTLINGSKTGFDGNAWDFEMLLAEDGHGNSATTNYYFWVELN